MLRNMLSKIQKIDDFKTCCGDLFKPVLSGKLLPDGTISLSEVDKIDIKAEINSHASTCDMAYILSRLRQGDSSVVNVSNGVYGDFTHFPKSYAEMLQLVQNGESAFESLPLDVRSKFDNNVSKWFASIGSDEWNDIMKINKPVPTVDVQPCVSSEVQPVKVSDA